MRNFLRKLTAAIGVGLFLLGALAASFPAFALTVPATYAPRYFSTQQTHYLRFTFNYNSCVLVFKGTSGYCTLKIGALPYNAFVVRAYQQVITAFNSTTNDSLAIGVDTNTTDTQLVALQGVRTSGGATSLTIVSANVGITATGNAAPPLGVDGGFDIYAQYQTLGSAAPTAGQAVIVIEYIAPNDGGCINPPIGSIPSAVGASNAC